MKTDKNLNTGINSCLLFVHKFNRNMHVPLDVIIGASILILKFTHCARWSSSTYSRPQPSNLLNHLFTTIQVKKKNRQDRRFIALKNFLTANQVLRANSCHFRPVVFPVDGGYTRENSVRSLLTFRLSQFQDIAKTSLY